MAFQVVDGNEGQVGGEGQGLGVGNADEERTGESGTAGHRNGVEAGKRDARVAKRGADHGNNGAEMLAAGKLGDDSAVTGMGGDLRGDNGAERVRAALNNGSGGLVAGRLDSQD